MTGIVIALAIVSPLLYYFGSCMLKGTLIHRCYVGRKKHKKAEAEQKQAPLFDKLFLVTTYKYSKKNELLSFVLFFANALLLLSVFAEWILCILYFKFEADLILYFALAIPALLVVIPFVFSGLFDRGYQMSKPKSLLSNIVFVGVIIFFIITLVIDKIR